MLQLEVSVTKVTKARLLFRRLCLALLLGLAAHGCGPDSGDGPDVEELAAQLWFVTHPAPPGPACSPGAKMGKIDEGAFEFQVPCDMIRRKVQGMDSQVGELQRPGLELSWDYGWVVGSELTGGQFVERLAIGDVPAEVVRFDRTRSRLLVQRSQSLPLCAAVFFPKVAPIGVGAGCGSA